MTDSLADMLNSISADPQNAAPAAQPPQDQLRSYGPLRVLLGGRMENLLSTTLPKVAAGMASFPTDLYNLGAAGAQYVKGEPVTGSDWASTVSSAIHDPVDRLSNRLAGEPVSDNLLSGDPSQLAASWFRLALSAGLSAPAGVSGALAQGIAKARASSEVLGTLAQGGATVLDALTPITIATKPSTKVAAANIAVAGALGSTLEGILGPSDTVARAKELVDKQAQGATDVAAQGIQEAEQADPRKVLAGLTDDPTYGWAAVGLLGIAALGSMRRDLLGKAWTGVRKAATGYDNTDAHDSTMQSFMTMFKQQRANRNESIEVTAKKMLKEGGYANVNQRADAIAEDISHRSGPSVNTRMQSAYMDGTLPDSAVKMQMPVNDWFALRQTLSPQEAQLLDRSLIAKQEVNTRRIDKVWFNLPDTQTRDLEAYVTQALANPKVALLHKTFLDYTSKAADYMDEQKRFTSKEIQLFRNKNPDYVPTRIEDGARWLSPRDIGMDKGHKTWEQAGSPSEFLPRYLDEVVRSTEGLKIKRDFMMMLSREANRGRTFATQIRGREFTGAGYKGPNLPHANADRYVHWRTPSGESRYTEVNDAVLRNALQDVTNPTALQLANGFLSSTSRLYEGGAVGTAAALTGSVFPLKSALYSATFGAVTRPKGIAMGWLDHALQKATGGKVGVPGDILTFAPDAAVRAALNVGAVLIHRGSRVLHNSVVRDGFFANRLGPQTAEAAAQALDRIYKRSGLYDLQQRGLMGPASYMSIDPARSYKNAKQMLEGHGLIRGTGTFVGDILHAISSGPAMSVMAMNKGKPRSEVSAAIRNMSGDPGKSGAFRGKWARGAEAEIVNATPWGNIYIQAASQLAKAARRNPLGLAAGIMTGVAMPDIMSTMWNAHLGPEYIDYQMNKRTPDRLGSAFYIGIPGKLPEEGVEIDIDPLMRPFKLMSTIYSASHLGLLDGTFFRADNADIQKANADMVGHRLLSLGKGSVGNAVAQQALIPPVPSVLQTAAAAHGLRINAYGDSSAIDEKRNAGFTEAGGKNAQTFLGAYTPAVLEEVLRGIGATAFSNIYRMINDAAAGAKEGKDWQGNDINPAKRVLQDAKQNVAGSTKMVGSGPLFDTFLALSPSQEAAGTLVKQKLDGLRKINDAFNQSTEPGGAPQTALGTNKRGFSPYLGTPPAQPADQGMAVLGRQVHEIYGSLNTAYMGAISGLYDQRQSVSVSGKFSPERKRYIMNEISGQIIDTNRRMLQDIERYESNLTRQLGFKVKFDQINLDKPSTGQ